MAAGIEGKGVLAGVLVVGIALGASLVWWLTPKPELAEAWKPQAVAQHSTASSSADRGTYRDAGTSDDLPPEAEIYPELFTDLEGEPPEERQEIPTRIEYPRLEKYVPAEPFSAVDHRIVGAWDESKDSDEPGRRRALVLVVSPDTSDAELEQLVRDIYREHRDAPMLNVRIFDSESAALDTGLTDGGALAFKHTVAGLMANDSQDRKIGRVRGRRIDL